MQGPLKVITYPIGSAPGSPTPEQSRPKVDPVPPVLAFSGFSQSGKTTLLSRVVELLSARGMRIGVVKHHAHGSGERPALNPAGKDSRILLDSGAVAVALSGPGEEATYHPQPGDPGPLAVAASLGEVDLVLAEGFKSWPGFKIEVFPPGREPGLRGDPLLLGLAGPEPAPFPGPRFFDRDDPDSVARFVEACFFPPGRLGPVPDRETCYGLWARFAMLPNIIIHSLMVAQAASRVAAALVRAGHDLDLPLVEAGALLHDIAKTECLVSRCNHAERGREIALGLGFPGVAGLVADHIDPVRTVDKAGLISPSTVVNYADKRGLHDRVTSIPDRIEDLVVRYTTAPEHEDRIRAMGREAQELEAKLFKGLDLTPDDLFSLNKLYYEGN